MAGKTTKKAAAKKKTAKKSAKVAKKAAKSSDDLSASKRIDKKIADLGDWRGERLAEIRTLIHEADPEVVEEWKWRKASSPGTPVWSHNGGICTGESYKQVVKLTFFHGASLKDPARLFNSSLEGNIRRAIDFHKDDAIEEAAFKELIRAAVAFNVAKLKQ